MLNRAQRCARMRVQGGKLHIQNELMPARHADEAEVQVVVACTAENLDCLDAILHRSSG